MRFTVEEYDSLSANPFTPPGFLGEVERLGFEVRQSHVTRRLLSLTGVIGDLIGVAHKKESLINRTSLSD